MGVVRFILPPRAEGAHTSVLKMLYEVLNGFYKESIRFVRRFHEGSRSSRRASVLQGFSVSGLSKAWGLKGVYGVGS